MSTVRGPAPDATLGPLTSSSRDAEVAVDHKYPLVLVRWWDAYSVGGWRPVSEVMHESADNRSVGWLIRECDEYLVLAQTTGGQAEADPMTHTTYHIPRGMVREVLRLKARKP